MRGNLPYAKIRRVGVTRREALRTNAIEWVVNGPSDARMCADALLAALFALRRELGLGEDPYMVNADA